MFQIAHHNETLNQTRLEVKWWKERAEEWKDEFKRADEERHKLIARVDDMVSQQLNVCPYLYLKFSFTTIASQQ